MNRQGSLPTTDAADDSTRKPTAASTTKGGVQKTKFTPTVPAGRRAKPDVQPPPTAAAGSAPNLPHRKPASLLATLEGPPGSVSGTFAHGFGTFAKKCSRDAHATGSVTGVKRTEHASPASDPHHGPREEALDLDSVVGQDPWSPVRIQVHRSRDAAVQYNTLNLLQLPGLLELLNFGDEPVAGKRDAAKTQPRGRPESNAEQVIDMDSFASHSQRAGAGSERTWPTNRVHRIGDVRFHKSGRVSIVLHGHCYSLSFNDEAAPSSTSVWAIDKDAKHIFEVGKVDASLVGRFQFPK